MTFHPEQESSSLDDRKQIWDGDDLTEAIFWEIGDILRWWDEYMTLRDAPPEAVDHAPEFFQRSRKAFKAMALLGAARLLERAEMGGHRNASLKALAASDRLTEDAKRTLTGMIQKTTDRAAPIILWRHKWMAHRDRETSSPPQVLDDLAAGILDSFREIHRHYQQKAHDQDLDHDQRLWASEALIDALSAAPRLEDRLMAEEERDLKRWRDLRDSSAEG